MGCIYKRYYQKCECKFTVWAELLAMLLYFYPIGVAESMTRKSKGKSHDSWLIRNVSWRRYKVGHIFYTRDGAYISQLP